MKNYSCLISHTSYELRYTLQVANNRQTSEVFSYDLRMLSVDIDKLMNKCSSRTFLLVIVKIAHHHKKDFAFSQFTHFCLLTSFQYSIMNNDELIRQGFH